MLELPVKSTKEKTSHKYTCKNTYNSSQKDIKYVSSY